MNRAEHMVWGKPDLEFQKAVVHYSMNVVDPHHRDQSQKMESSLITVEDISNITGI
jgi:hypothetical protein